MLKILELFAGIGAASKALERLNIEHEIVDAVEIDKYAIKSFNAIHGTNFEPQDICNWNKDVEVDLIMHGSPCQDFSLAGKQEGGDEGSGTRSSLMYETIRIVEKLKPKYVVWENVKNLLSKKHIHNFKAYLERMEQLGYTNYYQVLNAKDYGIPQNRERVFTISILGNGNYEFPKCEDLTTMPIDYLEENINEKYYLTKKNLEWLEEHNKNHKEKGTGFIFKPKDPSVDVANTIRANAAWCPTDNAFFEFPPKQELKLRLKDMLEDEVDEKYYLSDKMIEYISATGTANFKNHDCKINLDIARPLTTDQNKRAGTTNYLSNELPNNYDLNRCIQIGTLDIKGQDCIKRVYSDEGLSPTLTSMQGGNRQPKIEIKSKCKRLKALIKKTEFEEGKVLNMDLYNQTTNENISQCLTEPHHNSQRLFDGLRIRKLTPKECYRLMGFDDEDYERAAQINSNTQLYKQAGNSIVVNVLEAIFKNLLIENEPNVPKGQTTIFDFINVSNSK